MVFPVLPLCLYELATFLINVFEYEKTPSSPSVSISVAPVYQAFKIGSFRSMILTPSIAAIGKNVVLLALKPAEARKGLRAKTISSYLS
jgi:hypothetical protein